MDCSPPGSSHRLSGQNTEMGGHFLLQGIFPTPGLNPSLKFPSLAGRFFTTSATWEAHIWGYPTPIAIYSPPRIYRTHPNLGGLSSSSMSFLPFHTVHRVTQARILEWFAIPSSSGGPNGPHFFQNSSLWSIHLEWPHIAWLIASLSYTSPFAMTSLWSNMLLGKSRGQLTIALVRMKQLG